MQEPGLRSHNQAAAIRAIGHRQRGVVGRWQFVGDLTGVDGQQLDCVIVPRNRQQLRVSSLESAA